MKLNSCVAALLSTDSQKGNKVAYFVLEIESQSAMESKLFYKTDPKRLETKSELKGVYLKKPHLVSLYDINYDSIEPSKKIFYFKMPKTINYPLDLNRGYSNYIFCEKSIFSKHLEYTLKYVMSPEAQVNADNIDKIKVFTRRGTLANLMISYYSKKYANCNIRVTRYNGDLYMVHVEKDEEISSRRQTKNTHHEQLMKTVFTESLKDEPKIDEPCDENKRLIAVHQSTFGKFELTYHGEIHGILANKKVEDLCVYNDNLENLNACRFVMAKQMLSYLRNNEIKHLQYWVQAYLANVLDLYFAYKDKNGIVHRPIVHKLTSQLPKEFSWKPGICTEFLYEFLQRVNELLTKDDVNCFSTVYEIDYDSESKTFTYKIVKGNNDVIFITKEYLDYCKNINVD